MTRAIKPLTNIANGFWRPLFETLDRATFAKVLAYAAGFTSGIILGQLDGKSRVAPIVGLDLALALLGLVAVGVLVHVLAHAATDRQARAAIGAMAAVFTISGAAIGQFLPDGLLVIPISMTLFIILVAASHKYYRDLTANKLRTVLPTAALAIAEVGAIVIIFIEVRFAATLVSYGVALKTWLFP